MSDGFPAALRPPMALPPGLVAIGLGLRPARDADLPGLRSLYAQTRAAEMAAVPWPDTVKRAFLDDQFRLQHRHYVGHYAGADFQVLEHGRELVGRYYLLREAPAHLVVDISLFEAWRGRGIGAALLRASQDEARALGRGMHLHVVHDNLAARRLYERLGFALGPAPAEATHLPMHWSP